MRVESYVSQELACVFEKDAGINSRDELFRKISELVASRIPGMDRDSLTRALNDREEQSSTCTPEGVAFPHVIADSIERTMIVPMLVREGVDFGVESHPRADIILCMFGSSRDPWEHVKVLARLSRIVHTEEARARLRAARSAEELFNAITQEDRSHE